MPHLTVNGGSLYYETQGDEHPTALVFVHAGIANLRMWDGQAALADRCRVVRYDTRGYGETTTKDVPFSNRADLIALLDHLHIPKAVLIGCSRGGTIAMDAALEYPDRAAALVMVCSAPNGYAPENFAQPADEAEIEAAMQAADEAGDWDKVAEMDVRLWAIGPRRRAEDVSPAFIDAAYALARSVYAHVGENAAPIPLQPTAAGRLGELRLPVLVMAGLHDESYALSAADYMAQNIPGATKVVFENAAHLPSVEVPEQFNKTLVEWLAQCGIV